MSKKIIERRKASANVPEDSRASIANFEAKQKRSAVKGILLTVVIIIAIAALLFLVVNALINNISKNISPAGSYKDIDPVIAKDTLDEFKANNPLYNGAFVGSDKYDRYINNAFAASNNHSTMVNDIKDDESIFNYIIYGIENSDPENPSADLIVLASFDKTNNKLTYVLINNRSLFYIPYANVIGHLKDAYNFGGANLLTRTISQNLGIDIDGYVDMKMNGAAELVDLVGSIEVAMTDDEYETFKLAVEGYNARFEDEVLVPVKNGDTVSLDGKQTLAYLRGVAGLSNTEAIFKVFTEVTKRCIQNGVEGINALVEKISDNATTSTETEDFATLLKVAVNAKNTAVADEMKTMVFGESSIKLVYLSDETTFMAYTDYSKAVADLKTALYGE